VRPPRTQGRSCAVACGCLTAALLGIASLCTPAIAAEAVAPAIVVSPSGASTEIAPGGTVVLRGSPPPQPTPVARTVPTATLPGPVRVEGWDDYFDTSGIDRQYDTTGLVTRSGLTR
jgi:hypothetical protein